MTVTEYVEARKRIIDLGGRMAYDEDRAEVLRLKADCDSWWTAASKADKDASGPLYFAMYDKWARANPTHPRNRR